MNWISLLRLFGALLLAVTVISCAASSHDVAKVPVGDNKIGNNKYVSVGKIDFKKMRIPPALTLWPDTTVVAYRAEIGFFPSPAFHFSRMEKLTYRLNFSITKESATVEEIIIYWYPHATFRSQDREVIYRGKVSSADNTNVFADVDVIPGLSRYIEVRVRLSGYPHSISVSHHPGGSQELKFFKLHDDKMRRSHIIPPSRR